MPRSPRRRGEMPLREHLVELRRRLIYAGLGLVVGAVAGWFLYPPVFRWLQQPILDSAAENHAQIMLNFASVAGALDVRVKVACYIGVILTCPWWLYQLWAFVAPGLTRRERRVTVGYLAAGVPLFGAGVWLAWWLMPRAIALLTSFTPGGAANIIDAAGYLGFVMRMTLAFAVAFEVPVVMVALSALDLVTWRTWLRGWRAAVLIAAIFGAVATPTGDPLTMSAVAAPIVLLYFAAIGITYVMTRSSDRPPRRSSSEPMP